MLACCGVRCLRSENAVSSPANPAPRIKMCGLLMEIHLFCILTSRRVPVSRAMAVCALLLWTAYGLVGGPAAVQHQRGAGHGSGASSAEKGHGGCHLLGGHELMGGLLGQHDIFR